MGASEGVFDERNPGTTRADSLRPFAGIFAITICGVCAFLDMYCTQPLLPLFVQLFHASKAEAGLTVSASTLGVAAAAPFVGSYAERYNRKNIIVGSIFILALPTLFAATSRGLPALVFWRFLQGVLMPGIFATTIAYITEEWAESTVAIVMAVYVSGTVLGGFLGRLLAGMVADHYGWRWAFVMLAVATIAGALMVAAWLPHARHGGHIKGQSGSTAALSSGICIPRSFSSRKAALQDFSADSVAGEPLQAGGIIAGEHHLLRMLRHFQNSDLLVTFGIGFSILFALVSMFTYVTFHLAAPPYWFSTSALSLLFAVYLVGLIATPIGGVLLTRIGVRKGILGSVVLSLAGVLLTLAPQLWLIIVGLALCSSGVFIAQAAAITYLRQAAPPGTRVSAAGLYLSCYYIGGTVAGIAPGYAWRFGGWTACVALTGIVQLLTIALIVFGWRQRAPVHSAKPA